MRRCRSPIKIGCELRRTGGKVYDAGHTHRQSQARRVALRILKMHYPPRRLGRDERFWHRIDRRQRCGHAESEPAGMRKIMTYDQGSKERTANFYRPSEPCFEGLLCRPAQSVATRLQ